MKYHRIPDETIGRLPLYLRELRLLSQQGRQNIKSGEFADSLGVNSAQIRKDLSYFGAFGTPGVGYKVKKLLRQLCSILKLKNIHKVALVGVGNLGSALLSYSGFAQFGFEIVAAFDSDPNKIGSIRNNVTVEDTSKLSTLKNRGIKFAIIAVPASAAKEIADQLVKAGITGILNFAPSCLVVPKKVKVISIDIAIDLARLPYYSRVTLNK
ncbi:MAG: redox-sensing transcriptional repressor Rex [Planctomycetota bacterium]